MNGTTHDERVNLRWQVAQLERQLAEERSSHANGPSKDPPERQWHIIDTALSDIPDSTYIFDLEGRVVYANKTLLNLWCKMLDEAAGNDFGHDLFAYTRLAANENEVHQPVNAEIVFQKVSSSLQATIQSSGAFVSHATLPSVSVEEMHLHQLFQNLIGNAIKYRSKDVPRIHVSATRQEPLWRFAVEDNGIGIQSQFAEQVFGPFKRLHSKDAYEGIGIGPAICQKIVNCYGGRVWVESEPGCGSTFFFTLPV